MHIENLNCASDKANVEKYTERETNIGKTHVGRDKRRKSVSCVGKCTSIEGFTHRETHVGRGVHASGNVRWGQCVPRIVSFLATIVIGSLVVLWANLRLAPAKICSTRG